MPDQPAPSLPRTAAMAKTSVWEDVPDRILICIAANLPCRADRVNISCVNRHWCRALRGQGSLPQPPRLPPQLPWLIFPSTETPSFVCVTESKAHSLPLPADVRLARFCGSSNGGWFVLAFDARYALYNLMSGLRIDLPGGLDIPPRLNDMQARGGYLPLVVRAATLSSSPAHEPYMLGAIVLVDRRWCAAFWCQGRKSWLTPGSMGKRRRPQDVIYYRGGFYFVTSREQIVVYWPGRTDTGELIMNRMDYDMLRREDYESDMVFLRGHGSMFRYLVESRGHLHMVVRYIYSGGGSEVFRVFMFHVMPPAAHGKSPRATWLDLGELDGRMLFLGRGCSRSVEVARFDGFEDSMVYFLDDSFIGMPTADNSRWYSFPDMGKYSLDDMSFELWPPVNCRPSRSDNAPPTWWFH